MADEKAVLMYKGHPLMRKENMIYYGSMADSHIVMLQVLETKKGICFDYAALMTGMLRSQNVPCKLVVGYANKSYHAWISVWSADKGWINGAIFFDGSDWKLMDPTFASTGGGSSKVVYTWKYVY